MKLMKGVPQVVSFKSMKLLPLLILAFVLTLGVACFSEPDPLREAESYLKKGNAHVDAGFKAMKPLSSVSSFIEPFCERELLIVDEVHNGGKPVGFGVS